MLGWYDGIVAAVTEVTAGKPVPASGREAFAALHASVEPAFHGDAGDLTRDEVVSNAAVLMFGGIETTEGMIANALLHLLAEPGRARGASRPTARCCRTRSRSRCGSSRPPR